MSSSTQHQDHTILLQDDDEDDDEDDESDNHSNPNNMMSLASHLNHRRRRRRSTDTEGGSLVDSFSLHLPLHTIASSPSSYDTIASNAEDDVNNDNENELQSDSEHSNTSSITWLTYRDEKCAEVKEEFITRLKQRTSADDRILTVEERRVLLEEVVGDLVRRDESDRTRQRRQQRRRMNENVEVGVEGNMMATTHPAALFDSNWNFVGVSGNEHQYPLIGSGGLSSSLQYSNMQYDTNYNHDSNNNSNEANVIIVDEEDVDDDNINHASNSVGGVQHQVIMSGVDLLLNTDSNATSITTGGGEDRAMMAILGSSLYRPSSRSATNTPLSQQQLLMDVPLESITALHHHQVSATTVDATTTATTTTTDNASSIQQQQQKHYEQLNQQQQIQNTLQNLQQIITNQQSLIDTLTSKLHNSELANTILSSKQELLQENYTVVQCQLMERGGELEKLTEELGDLKWRLGRAMEQCRVLQARKEGIDSSGSGSGRGSGSGSGNSGSGGKGSSGGGSRVFSDVSGISIANLTVYSNLCSNLDSPSVLGAGSGSGGNRNNNSSGSSKLAIQALEAKLKQMDEVNQRLVKENVELTRAVSLLRGKQPDERGDNKQPDENGDDMSGQDVGSASDGAIMEEDCDSESAIAEVRMAVKDKESVAKASSSMQQLAPITALKEELVSIPVVVGSAARATEWNSMSPSSSSSSASRSKTNVEGMKLVTSKDITASQPRKPSSSSSASLAFLRDKQQRATGSSSSNESMKQKQQKSIVVIPSLQDHAVSKQQQLLSSSSSLYSEETRSRRTTFVKDSDSNLQRQSFTTTTTNKGRGVSHTKASAVVKPPRRSASKLTSAAHGGQYNSQIASSNKLFNETKLLSGLVSRLKLSNRLSSRTNSTAVMRVENLSTKLVPLIGEPKFCAMIYNVLSAEECQDLIRRAKGEQFEQLCHRRRQSSSMEEGKEECVSCCKRVRMNDSELAEDLLKRIRKALRGSELERSFVSRDVEVEEEEEVGVDPLHGGSAMIKGKRTSATVSRISEPFNVIRYDVGDFFAPHRDNTFRMGTEVSRLTVQIFLNEKFTGGKTSIRHGKKFLDLKPKVGSVLLMDQELRREECYVVSGKKYVIRADVMYDECKADVGTAVTESAFTRSTRDTRDSGYSQETNPV